MPPHRPRQRLSHRPRPRLLAQPRPSHRVTYFHSTTEASSQTITPNGTTANGPKLTTTRDGTALTIDPELVFVPFPHVGLTLGTIFDIGVGGSVEAEQPDVSSITGNPTTTKVTADNKQSNYGVAAGLLVFF